MATGDGPALESECEEFEAELREYSCFEAEEDLDLGACCACRETGKTVCNLLMLPLRAPGGGGGWGCAVCHLPCEGAVAVLCDRCREEKREVLDVCAGFPALGRRVPLAGLSEPWDHDYALHPETWEEEGA